MNIYIALVHYPVYNKNGEIVATSITTLDVHDISRIAKTYDVTKFFLVTPLESQCRVVNRMITHWKSGFGSTYNPTRQEALSRVEVSKDIDCVKKKIKRECGDDPIVIATCAKKNNLSLSFLELRQKFSAERFSFLLLLGTGWGLTKDVIKDSDYILEPIEGVTDFNHLPVRAAAAIIIDRLIGRY